MKQRPRRLRKTNSVRNLIKEHHLTANDFVWPVFIKEGKHIKEEIKAMPDCYRYSLDVLLKEVKDLVAKGLQGLALFPVIDDKKKTSNSKEALNKNGLVPMALKKLKDAVPSLTLISDIALDPFSSDGHDGIVKNGKILNDETVKVLSEMALLHSESGADFVAPSDMMDGRVAAIREILDENKFTDTGIIAYAAKYASAFYGPFRDALDSAPRFGDKKTYQMDPANRKEALKEVRLDIKEGADIILIKPALNFLDIICEVKRKFDIPVAAYNVSGEYSMIKFAAKANVLNEEQAMMESLLSIKRAGADIIFSYFTPSVLQFLSRN